MKQDDVQRPGDDAPAGTLPSPDASAADARTNRVDISDRGQTRRQSWKVWTAAGLIALAGGTAYWNSLQGAFVLDDVPSIVGNPSIGQLWPPWKALSPPEKCVTVRGRPVLNLSLAVNHALGDLDVRGYHAVNVAIHILAALLLFGILRRTFESRRLKDTLGRVSLRLALAISLLWTLHPLQTESVTYVVQRAESMVGLFYLATLYCVIRGAASSRAVGWYILAVVACAAGMATKEVMVTAPLVVLLYDRQFLADSLGGTLRRRWGLYLGLAATWVLLIYLVIAAGPTPNEPGSPAPSVFFYARTQPEVILHYLRLSFWPHPHCLDYWWPIADSWQRIVPGLVVVGALGLAVAWGWIRGSGWAFLGVWFFLILAPTSSVLPLKDLAFEHRMYLPLAAVVAAAVLVGRAACRRLAVGGPATNAIVACLLAVVGATLGVLTFQRNRDYRSDLSIWQNTVVQVPGNPRAHLNLGNALCQRGKLDEAIEQYRKSLQIKPDFADAHFNLGNTLGQQGQVHEAIACYRRALELNAKHAAAHNNLGNALRQQGNLGEAIEHLEKALQINPQYAEAHLNLGVAFGQSGRTDEAIDHCRKALEIKPGYMEAHNNLGNALSQQGRVDEAIQQYRETLQIKPDYCEAHYNLGNVLRRQGDVDEAIVCYQKTLELNPRHATAHHNLGCVLGQQGKADEAIKHFRDALEIRPQNSETYGNLGMALYERGDAVDALAAWRQCLRLQPNNAAVLNLAAWVLATHPEASLRNGAEATEYARRACDLLGNADAAALDTLAAACAESGRFAEAEQAARQALALATAQNNAPLAGKIESHIRLYQSSTPYRDSSPSAGLKSGGR